MPRGRVAIIAPGNPDDPGDAAASIGIEPRISGRVEDRSGADDVRAAEEHDRVAVAVRRGDVKQLHGLAIREERPLGVK